MFTMTLPVFSYFFIGLSLLFSKGWASIPTSYPFDKPTFGNAKCDDSLPNPPPMNPQLREDARNKLAEIGSVNPQRISPLPELNLFRAVPISNTAPSPGRPYNGESPTMLFQYWESPLLYEVYTSKGTAKQVDKGGASIKGKIRTAVYDVLSTCCQYGNAGVQFVQTSDDRHDYIEVYVLHSPNRPSDNPLAATSSPEPDTSSTPRGRSKSSYTPLRTSSEGAEPLRPKLFPDSPDRSTVATEDEHGANPPADELMLSAVSQLTDIPPNNFGGNNTLSGSNIQSGNNIQSGSRDFVVNISALEALFREWRAEDQSNMREIRDAIQSSGICIPANQQSMSRSGAQGQQQNRPQDANKCTRCLAGISRIIACARIDESCLQAMNRHGEEMQGCLHLCTGISVPIGVCAAIAGAVATIYIAVHTQ